MDADCKLQFKDMQKLQPYTLNGVVPTGKQLGHGAFGSVVELQMNGGAICAGKKIHDALVNPQNEGMQRIVGKFVSECELMSKMRHPNVVNFYGLAFLSDNAPPVLVMERLDRSLEDYLERVQAKDLPFSIRVSILYDVAKGLVFLHAYIPPIVHRDLTARNILLTRSMQAKIADLGNSRIINADALSRTLSQAPGTLLYMPPEALEYRPTYDASLDMFSFGHVALYVLGHIFPSHLLPATYPDPSARRPNKLCARSEVERRANYLDKLESNEMIPCQLVHTVKACLDNIPSNRPTSKEMSSTLSVLLEQHEDEYELVMKMRICDVPSEKNPAVSQFSPTGRKSSHLMTRITGGNHFLLEMLTWYGGFGPKRKDQVWKKYMFQLVNETHLRYYSKLNDKPRQVLSLKNVLSVTALTGIPQFRFLLRIQQRGEESRWHLKADTEEERTCWIEAIENCIHPREHDDDQEYLGSAEYVEIQSDPAAPKRNPASTPEEDLQQYQVLQNPNPPAVYWGLDKPKKKSQTIQEEHTGPVYDLPIPPGNNYSRFKSSLDKHGNDQPPTAHLGRVYDEPTPRSRSPQPQQGHELRVPTLTGRPGSGDFSQDQMAFVIDILQKMVDGQQYATATVTSPGARHKQPALYDDIVTPPKSKKGSLYENISDEGLYETIPDQLSANHKAKPAPPPKPVKTNMPREDSKQTIKSLLRQSGDVDHMLVTEDEVTYDVQKKHAIHPRRPTWSRAKTVADTQGSVTISQHEIETLYIPRANLLRLTEITEGEFGKIYQAQLRNLTGELVDVAVKTLKCCEDEKERYDFEREMALSAHPQMKHPNIVQVFGLVKKENWIVMEYLPLGDLKTFLINNARPVQRLIKYMLDVALGMKFLSDQGLVHRDLAARNVLLGPGEMCKVCDFGMLRSLPNDENYYVQTSSSKCPIRWMAPESLSDNKFSSASDVWSFGILLWEMFNPSEVPYEDYTNLQVVAKVSHMMTPSVPDNCPQRIATMMKACWCIKPAKRPSFLVLAHELTKMNFGIQ